MTSIDSVLQTYGNGINADDFAEQLGDVMRRRVAADPRALSLHDRQVLTTIGVPAADLDRQPTRSLVVEAARVLEENMLALTAAAAAERLGRSVVRIRGAIADGSLYGVKVGRSWLVPRWQLDQAQPLPHLRKVIAVIPEGTSAVTLERVMTLPSAELYVDGQPVSPRNWLLAGNDPAAVVDMVRQLYAW
jgi:excisionase family DNA binding protein